MASGIISELQTTLLEMGRHYIEGYDVRDDMVTVRGFTSRLAQNMSPSVQ